jgi:hypothetical protein
MEHRYSFEEYADMHLMYGRADGNRALARRLYLETFPNRRLPNEKTFQRVDERLRGSSNHLLTAGDVGLPVR